MRGGAGVRDCICTAQAQMFILFATATGLLCGMHHLPSDSRMCIERNARSAGLQQRMPCRVLQGPAVWGCACSGACLLGAHVLSGLSFAAACCAAPEVRQKEA